MHTFDQRLTTADFSFLDCLFGNWWRNLWQKTWYVALEKFALYTKNTTAMGFEPTRGERIGLAVQRLNHSATLCSTVEIRVIISFSFLISIDSNCNPPIDAHFWSAIDYCWFFLSWLFVCKLMKKSLTENLICSAGKICFVYEKYDRDGIGTHARRTYWISSPTP